MAARAAAFPEKGEFLQWFRSLETEATPSSEACPLGWAAVDEWLPEGGLPLGVVELRAPAGLGGASRLALAAVRAAQRRHAGAWCAWLDPEGSLYAPGVLQAGVVLQRLLVLRPPRPELGRVALKAVQSSAFEAVVIDMQAIGGLSSQTLAATPLSSPLAAGLHVASATARGLSSSAAPRRQRQAWPEELLVRKLALAARQQHMQVLLLSDARCARALPWPVALRLELTRPTPALWRVELGKERHGRWRNPLTLPLAEVECGA